MYTDKKNILQLVALLKEHSINKIVLCPGSRNSPIVHTLANHPFFTCDSVTDERSAGFFCHGPGIARRKTGRRLLYFGYGFAEYPSGCGGSLPACSSYRHIGRPSGEPG